MHLLPPKKKKCVKNTKKMQLKYSNRLTNVKWSAGIKSLVWLGDKNLWSVSQIWGGVIMEIKIPEININTNEHDLN